MSKVASLTDSEWKIMNLLWDKNPLTITQIEKLLKSETNWSKHSIISFLKRMTAKEAVEVRETERAKLYYPKIEKNQVVIQETKSFLKKIYSGNIGLMVSSMVKEEELSKEEIEDLIKILHSSKEGGE